MERMLIMGKLNKKDLEINENLISFKMSKKYLQQITLGKLKLLFL